MRTWFRLALVPILLASLAPRPARAAAAAATLEEVEGDVVIVRAADGSQEDAEDDAALREGDRVRTAAGASALVSFADAHLVHLGESSELEVTEVRPQPTGLWARLRLLGGHLFASCDKLTGSGAGFTVETSTTVAAVKGTTFGVDAAGGGSVSVLEGTVMTSGRDAQGRAVNPVPVGAGQATTVDPTSGRPAVPHDLDRDPRAGWLRERLAAIRSRGAEHRAMRRSGELRELRRLRRLAREGRLAGDPRARAFLARHPAFAAHFERAAARHRLLLQRRGPRPGAGRPAADERRERRRAREGRRGGGGE